MQTWNKILGKNFASQGILSKPSKANYATYNAALENKKSKTTSKWFSDKNSIKPHINVFKSYCNKPSCYNIICHGRNPCGRIIYHKCIGHFSHKRFFKKRALLLSSKDINGKYKKQFLIENTNSTKTLTHQEFDTSLKYGDFSLANEAALYVDKHVSTIEHHYGK